MPDSMVRAVVQTHGIGCVIHIATGRGGWVASVTDVIDATGKKVARPVLVASYVGATPGAALDLACDAVRSVFGTASSE